MVIVCYAAEPNTCTDVKVSGYALATLTGGGNGTGLIEVTVNDPYNAGWSVTWSYAGQSYSVSQGRSYAWFINPPYVPIQISFQASITQNPGGYTCQIQPSQTSGTYTAGSVQKFNVTCYSVAIQVNDPYGAGWSISLSPPSGLTWSGSSTQTLYVNQVLNYPQSVSASITSVPYGYNSCNITGPTQITGPGEYTYNVQCTGTLTIYFTVSYSYPYPVSGSGPYWGWDVKIEYPNGISNWLYFTSNQLNGQSTFLIYNGPPGATVETIQLAMIPGTCPPQTTNTPYLKLNPNPPITYSAPGNYTIYGSDGCPSSSGSSGYADFYLTVNAPSSYSWAVTATGAATEYINGQGSVTNLFWFSIQPTNNEIYFSASSGCTVSPTYVTPNKAGNYYVTVDCGGSSGSGSNSISVSVINDTLGAGWSVSWSGSASGSKSGTSDASWSVTASGTVDFTASITSNPSGYTCTISPSSTSASPGGSVTFTVSCTSNQPPPTTVYGCFLTTSATSSPSGIPVSVSPNGTTFIPSGSSTWVYFSAPSSVTTSSGGSGQSWYQFQYWELSFSGSGSTNLPSNPTQTTGTNPSVYYTCPSGLTQNVTATISGTAYYQKDYVTLTGPTQISSGTNPYTFTVSWSLSPYSATQESWSITTINNAQTLQVSVTVYAQNQGGSQIQPGATWDANLYCTSGQPVISSYSPQGTTTYATGGTSGSASITVTATGTCVQTKAN